MGEKKYHHIGSSLDGDLEPGAQVGSPVAAEGQHGGTTFLAEEH